MNKKYDVNSDYIKEVLIDLGVSEELASCKGFTILELASDFGFALKSNFSKEQSEREAERLYSYIKYSKPINSLEELYDLDTFWINHYKGTHIDKVYYVNNGILCSQHIRCYGDTYSIKNISYEPVISDNNTKMYLKKVIKYTFSRNELHESKITHNIKYYEKSSVSYYTEDEICIYNMINEENEKDKFTYIVERNQEYPFLYHEKIDSKLKGKKERDALVLRYFHVLPEEYTDNPNSLKNLKKYLRRLSKKELDEIVRITTSNNPYDTFHVNSYSDENDPYSLQRITDLISHGMIKLYESTSLLENNKKLVRKI